MFTQAVVPVEVIDHEPVQPASDSLTHPRLEHRLPGWVAQASPVLVHTADCIGTGLDRRSVGILFEQAQGIGGRSEAERLFIPEVAVELEEAARPFRAVGVSTRNSTLK